jgi:hypothetical protein
VPSQILADHWNAELVTEHAKQPDDPRGLALSNEANDEPAGDTSPLQDVEAQMRRALGLFGLPRRQDAAQPAATRPARPADRLSLGSPKRRFVQDGEVPVTVLNGRRTSPTDAPVNRLEAVETAVASERAARERAERARAEAQATIPRPADQARSCQSDADRPADGGAAAPGRRHRRAGRTARDE